MTDDDAQIEDLDPDFNFLEEDLEAPASGMETTEEFRFDRSTKIPAKEAEALLNEIVEDFDHKYREYSLFIPTNKGSSRININLKLLDCSNSLA